MEFETKLKKIQDAYQKSFDALKIELRAVTLKQIALMKVINTMADEIAQRNLLIEELCECIDLKHVEVAQRARRKIEI